MKRPFRALRRPPDARYDALVVGAGVGGLVAANLLAKQGLRTLLVEQHYMAGGYCSTFRRGGYTFDAATHFYPLLGDPRTLTGRVLAEIGVGTRWVKMDPVDTFHFPDGSRFAVPADLGAYRAKLERDFPAERRGLDRFFEDVRVAYLHGLLHFFRGRTTPALAPFLPLTVRDALDRHITDRKLTLLLTADCPHWGAPPNRTSFVFDSMLRLSYFLGNFYPVGGSQAFADELARCFEERGGHILMSTRAERLTIASGRVTGAQLITDRGPAKGAHRVSAGVVIGTADLRQTVEQLVGLEHLPRELVERVRRLRPSWPCYLTHLGVRGVPTDELDAVQGYYWRHWDADRFGRGSLRCKIFVPTVYDPGLAPAGRQVIILQKVVEEDFEAIRDWGARKRGIETLVTRHLESLLPGIRGQIEVCCTATSRTAHHFTGNLAGAMLGWEMSPRQLGEDRPPQHLLPGLRQVGHWTRPGGGITPVIVSAVMAAEEIAGGSRPSFDATGNGDDPR